MNIYTVPYSYCSFYEKSIVKIIGSESIYEQFGLTNR